MTLESAKILISKAGWNCTYLAFCSAAAVEKHVGAKTAKCLGPASPQLCLNPHRPLFGCPGQGSTAETFFMAHVPRDSIPLERKARGHCEGVK